MEETRIGFLRRGDVFVFGNNTYKILGVGNKDINNVRCQNIKNRKIEWFDVDSDVWVKESD